MNGDNKKTVADKKDCRKSAFLEALKMTRTNFACEDFDKAAEHMKTYVDHLLELLPRLVFLNRVFIDLHCVFSVWFHPQCLSCGKTQNLLRCQECHLEFFCGISCQRRFRLKTKKTGCTFQRPNMFFSCTIPHCLVCVNLQEFCKRSLAALSVSTRETQTFMQTARGLLVPFPPPFPSEKG